MPASLAIKRTPGRPAASAERDARELLLTAATELFAAQGVAATTFAMIAKRAGLTPAMLHYYFKDREQLLDAVVEERLLRVLSKVWDPVQPGIGAAQAIRGIVARLLEGIEEMPWIPSTWMREVLNEGGLLRERMLRRLPYEKLRIVAQAIAQGQSQKSLNPELDPLLTVFSALGMVMLLTATTRVWSEIFHRLPLSRRALQRHIAGLLLDGVCHRPCTPSKTVIRRKKKKGGNDHAL
jgi:TetR/AcrR family transcriptional regulator